MNPIRVFIGAACMLTAGCDLPELSQGMDGGANGDGALPAKMDLGANASTDLAGDDGSGIPNGAAIGSCDPARWTATASDSHPVNPPSYAIDGLAPTRWSTGTPQAAGEYLQIDFGGFVMVSQVTLDHTFGLDGKDDYARRLDVLASYDGTDFSRHLQSASYDADPGVATIDFPAHAARSVRLQLTAGAAMSWWSIHELRIGCQTPGDGGVPPLDGGVNAEDGGLPDGGVNPNHAAWTAIASSTNGGEGPALAFDGNPMTRWADGKTPQYGDEWFRLDMGQLTGISQVWLSAAAGDHPSAWELDLSLDDKTWSPVARGLGADQTRITFPRQNARYIRIKQIGSGYDHWWSINELTVLQ